MTAKRRQAIIFGMPIPSKKYGGEEKEEQDNEWRLLLHQTTYEELIRTPTIEVSTSGILDSLPTDESTLRQK